MRYITDEDGKRLEVVMPVEEYERLVEALEDLQDARAADETRAAIERGEDELIPLGEALEEMRRNRANSGLRAILPNKTHIAYRSPDAFRNAWSGFRRRASSA